MNERRVFGSVLLLIAAGAGYLTLVLWRAEESGKWLFLIVAALFLFFATRLLLPERPDEAAATPPTRFVSHRFLSLTMLVIVLGVIAAIVTALIRD